jgi:hypothetical protein
LAGKFLKNEESVRYMPALDLVGSGQFKFPENENNISPFSKQAKAFTVSQPLSLTSLAASCEIDRDQLAKILKSIFVKFIESGRAG